VSDDKTTWSVPAGLTNPLISYQAGHQIADSELIMSGSTLYYIYLDITGGNTLVMEQHSTDGITWSAATTILTAADTALVSPSFVWDGSQFVMHSINLVPEPNTLERRTCATLTGTWSAAETCTCAVQGGMFQWHLSTVLANGVWYAFLNFSQVHLYLAESRDGITWSLKYALLSQSASDIWDKNIYRSTAVKTATGFDLWYSGYSAGNEWYIGYAPIVGA
jgi:hypothetical protein